MRGRSAGRSRRGVEGVAVDGADRDRVRRAAEDTGGGGERGVRDGAGEGDPAQLGAAVAGAGRGLVPGQQALVEVHRGQIAELRDGDVQQGAGGGLQIEGVAYPGAGLVEQGEVTAGVGGLPLGPAPAGHIGGERGDPYGAAAGPVQPVERHRPAAAVLVLGRQTDQLHLGDRLAGVQDAAQRGGHPLGLGPRQEVMRTAAAVLARRTAEDRGEPFVDPQQPQVRAEQREAHGRLTENSLRSGEVGFDTAQRPDIDDQTDRGALPVLVARRHHIDLGEPVGLAGGLPAVGHQAGPLPAVEDLGHLAVPGLPQLPGDERRYRVLAQRITGGDAEHLLRPLAPLLDPPVGTERERGHPDVVVDRSGPAALPYGRTLQFAHGRTATWVAGGVRTALTLGLRGFCPAR